MDEPKDDEKVESPIKGKSAHRLSLEYDDAKIHMALLQNPPPKLDSDGQPHTGFAVVCGESADFPDNVWTECRECGTPVTHRPYITDCAARWGLTVSAYCRLCSLPHLGAPAAIVGVAFAAELANRERIKKAHSLTKDEKDHAS